MTAPPICLCQLLTVFAQYVRQNISVSSISTDGVRLLGSLLWPKAISTSPLPPSSSSHCSGCSPTSWRPTTGGTAGVVVARSPATVASAAPAPAPAPPLAPPAPVSCSSCSSSCSCSCSCSYSFFCSSYYSSFFSYCDMPVRRDGLAFLTGWYLDYSPGFSSSSSIPAWT